jgi:hypothetical protein
LIIAGLKFIIMLPVVSQVKDIPEVIPRLFTGLTAYTKEHGKEKAG